MIWKVGGAEEDTGGHKKTKWAIHKRRKRGPWCGKVTLSPPLQIGSSIIAYVSSMGKEYISDR